MTYKASVMSKLVCTATLSLGFTTVAWAHHSISNFDLSKQYIFHGTVKTVKWVNPHVWLYLEVQKADGTTELWGYETDGPNMLIRAGMNSNFVKVGDKISVYAAPEREADKRNGFLRKIVLADGRELVPSGGIGPAADGPPAGGPPGGGAPAGNPPAGPVPGFGQPVTPVEYK